MDCAPRPLLICYDVLNAAARVRGTFAQCLLLYACLAASAATSAAENLDQVQKRIAKLEESLANETIKFANARREVLDIERRLQVARQDKQAFKEQLEAKSARISDLRQQRETLQNASARTSQALASTLSARFMLWHQPKLKILLSDTDLPQLQRNLRYYDYVALANSASLEQQSSQLGQIEEIESALKLEASKLQHLRDRSTLHFNMLTTALAGRNNIAAILEKLLTESELALDLLQQDRNQLAKLVDDVAQNRSPSQTRSAPFGGLKGKLSWPTSGRIAKAPGNAMREGGAKWSGVIIESTPGSKVAAIADGRIAFADWFRNLGLLVIIDHGDGYMSLYGHNQELYKSSGDTVHAGEVVATVGDTGGHSATGLYFEIRQNGTPQDPRRWCRKQSQTTPELPG